jgi:predicted acylesterase/phospholipase RssA
LNVTDAIIHFIGDGSALSHLNASNVDFGTLSTTVFPVSGVTAGTYGSSSNVSQVTIDQYGRVTSATNVAVTSSQWTGTPGSPIYYIPGVGIGSSDPATANLQVTGNVYVSNSVTTTNVYAATEILTGTTDQTTLNVTGNVYVSNAVTTMNVFATRYYGDGGFLSNISSDAITQPFANLVVSNSVTTANVFVHDTLSVDGSMTANTVNTTFFFDTLMIPFIITSNLTVSNLIASTGDMNVYGNVITNGYIQAIEYYGDGGLLSNITATTLAQPLANLVVSNSVTTTNLFAATEVLTGTTGQTTLNVTGNVYVSNSVTTTNVHVTDTLDVVGSMTANAANATFFFDTFTIPYINTQYLNVASNIVLTGNLSAPLANITTLNVNYLTVNSAIVYGTSTLNVYGVSNLSTATVVGSTGQTTLNVTGNVYVSNAVTTTNVFAATEVLSGIPGRTTVNVTGNIYASNAVTTTNLFANTLIMSNATSRINVTGNIYASNAVTTTNLFTAGITSNVTSTTLNYDTLTIPFVYTTTLNVASTSNLDVVTITGEPGLTSLNVTGNIYASNAVTTTNVFATTLSTTNPIPFRNRIINGGMTVWQRNTASISTTSCVYTTADRWCGALGTSGLILSQWPGPTEAPQFPYSLQVTTSTTTSGVPLVEQRIEYLNIPDFLNGTPVTVSFYAGQPYGTLMPLTVGLYYATVVNNFGTQTLAVAATKNTPTLTTSNVYYTLNFTLTTSLGATNGLSLRFTTGAASAIGSTVLLTGVQVEKGLLATPFEVRPYVTELALCQRYYYQLTSPTAAVQGSGSVYAIFGTATGITTTAFWLPIQFPGPMRTPNYLLSNSAVSNFHLLPTGTTTITSVGLQTDSYTPVGATLNFVGTNITAGSSYIFRTNNLSGSTTAFFGFSCEL